MRQQPRLSLSGMMDSFGRVAGNLPGIVGPPNLSIPDDPLPPRRNIANIAVVALAQTLGIAQV